MGIVRHVIIVGGGLAAAASVEALRKEGFDGTVTILGEESHLPYERPPLSKGYLQGMKGRDEVFVHSRDWYDAHRVELHVGDPVTSLETGSRTVTTASGHRLGYDALILATGSSPRRLEIPGADLEGVHMLRTLEDSDALRGTLDTVERMTIIGAGWIGMEVAAAARAAGVDVTLLETLRLPLERVLGPEVAEIFARLHRDHGVDLRTGVHVKGLVGDQGRVVGVQLDDGGAVAAEAVLVAVGIAPNVRLASDAGLEVDNGVLVDEHLRTSDHAVYAVGDVANAWHPILHKRIRVEHWANALHQPEVAAAGIVGRSESYERFPYFFTDQYDVGMEYVGYVEPGGYDDLIIRGDVVDRRFMSFWMSNGRIVAAMHCNVWEESEALTALVTSGRQGDRQQLADLTVPLSALVT